MTSDDIKKVQILATLKDGRHILAISDDCFLIKVIVEYCEFVVLKDSVVEECSLKGLIKED